MHRPKYRLALLVDALDVSKWVGELADWASDHPTVELVALILSPRQDTATDKLLRLETRFLCRKHEYRAYSNRYSIAGRAPVIDAADVGTIEALRLDAIVCCGPSDETLAQASRDGIIALRAGCFAEVVDGSPETPFAIERQSRTGEREDLFRGSVATALLYSWNMISLHARAYPYMQRIIEQLAEGRASGSLPARGQERSAGARDLLVYAIRTGRRSASKALRRMLGKEFNWQVAFYGKSWPKCRLNEAIRVPNPPNAFLADPFTITVDGVTTLFVEEFPFDTRKGVISAYRLERDKAERIGVVLEEPHHLSFPFVFEHDGEIYMVPEGGGGGSVKLYKSTNFPTAWTEVKVLLPDVPAVDTVLFAHGSRWWMLTTIAGDGPGLNNAELHAFYADDPLGDWTPHAQNPIVMDASKGRNGGFLRDERDAPCRVAQVPGFTFYGAGFAVYRIDELTPESYRETLVQRVEPNFFPKLDGTHHLHSAHGLTVFDYMRVERPGRPENGRLPRLLKRWLDAPRGFEPRLTESESVVLPLDDGAAWEAAR